MIIVKALILYKDGNIWRFLLLTRAKEYLHGMDDLPGGKLDPDELTNPGFKARNKRRNTALC